MPFSDDSPTISSLPEIISPLTDGDMEIFVDIVEKYMGRFLADQPPLLRLLRAFCAYLKTPSSNRAEAIARAWVIYGALQMQCAFPVSPLDPSIVNAFKISITRDEVS